MLPCILSIDRPIVISVFGLFHFFLVLLLRLLQLLLGLFTIALAACFSKLFLGILHVLLRLVNTLGIALIDWLRWRRSYIGGLLDDVLLTIGVFLR
jgi:hypothetical protein